MSCELWAAAAVAVQLNVNRLIPTGACQCRSESRREKIKPYTVGMDLRMVEKTWCSLSVAQRNNYMLWQTQTRQQFDTQGTHSSVNFTSVNINRQDITHRGNLGWHMLTNDPRMAAVSNNHNHHNIKSKKKILVHVLASLLANWMVELLFWYHCLSEVYRKVQHEHIFRWQELNDLQLRSI